LKTAPEQTLDERPESLPTSGSPIRPLAILFLGVLLIFFCALLWLTIARRPRFDARNTPEALLAGISFGSLTNLPDLAEFATNLSSADLAFGEEQMNQMARDRAELTRYISKDDPIWLFCAGAFAGAAIGERILWDNASPEDAGYRSENLGPYQGRRGFIRIRNISDWGNDKGQPLSCEELWSCAVFEIENIRNHKAFMVLFDQALAGKLTREEWIRECSRLEYNALLRTRRDFAKLWLPLARTRHITITRSFWGADVPSTYQEWISWYRDPNSYPWDNFGTYYDRKIVPYVKSVKKSRQVAR
jgi:hypothetical protein